ncbi:MAG: sugar ABC transporter permease, partial [Ruminococcus sp.]|nr:sugar ABC transporter permease [Ruminococcus sp.]
MIKSYKARRIISNGLIYLILIIMGIIWVSPFAYLLMHSFRAESTIAVPYLIPHEWTFKNYADL